MSRIIIHGPKFIEPLIRETDQWGVFKFSYAMVTVYFIKADGSYIHPRKVAMVLKDLQETFGLGFLGDGPFNDGYNIIMTDKKLLATSDPAMGGAMAVRANTGWIAFSNNTGSWTLRDTLAHEIAHELHGKLTAEQEEEFWEIIKQDPIFQSFIWENYYRERFAEYASAALWGCPIDARMPMLDTQTLAKVAAHLRKCVPTYEAEITIDKDGDGEPEEFDTLTITLTNGSNIALVNGREVEIMPGHPEVKAIIMHDYFYAPVAFFTRIVNDHFAVSDREWNPETKQGTFTFRK